jgi:hypothetical protein
MATRTRRDAADRSMPRAFATAVMWIPGSTGVSSSLTAATVSRILGSTIACTPWAMMSITSA